MGIPLCQSFFPCSSPNHHTLFIPLSSYHALLLMVPFLSLTVILLSPTLFHLFSSPCNSSSSSIFLHPPIHQLANILIILFQPSFHNLRHVEVRLSSVYAARVSPTLDFLGAFVAISATLGRCFSLVHRVVRL